MSEREPSTPPGFMLYRESAFSLTLVPEQAAGAAIQAACRFFLTGEETDLDGPAGQLYQLIRASIIQNTEKYQRKCEQNRENARKRWGIE